MTQINESMSELQPVQYGVPQGSILGPLLFLMMINDLPNYLNFSECLLYADDTTLVFSDKDIQNLTGKLNADLNKLASYCTINKLLLNPSKSKLMYFSKHKENIILPDIFLNAEKIELVSEFKFLGFYLNDSLNWNEHIQRTTNKLKSCISIIIKTKNQLPLRTRKTIFQAIGMSHINYCSIVIFNAPKYQLHNLEVQYNEVCRALLDVRRWDRVPTCKLLETLELCSFSDVLHNCVVSFIKNCICSKAPNWFSDIFTCLNPRTLKITYTTQYSSQICRLNCFTYWGVSFWNKILSWTYYTCKFIYF
jgi:hypothetical protein